MTVAEESKIICVACPKGCLLSVSRKGETILVSNQGCKHGKQYAIQELTDPRRMVATTICMENARHPLLPVYTSAPFPKGQIRELLNEIRRIKLSAPVKMGSVVAKDILGSGIDIVASRDME